MWCLTAEEEYRDTVLKAAERSSNARADIIPSSMSSKMFYNTFSAAGLPYGPHPLGACDTGRLTCVLTMPRFRCLLKCTNICRTRLAWDLSIMTRDLTSKQGWICQNLPGGHTLLTLTGHHFFPRIARTVFTFSFRIITSCDGVFT